MRRPLAQQDRPFRVGAAAVPAVRAACVEAPVPKGEYENIGEPERSGGLQQCRRRFHPCRQRLDQERQRQNQGKSDHCAHDVTQKTIESMASRTIRDHRRNQQNDNDHEQQPTRPYGKERRKRGINASHGKKRDDCRPARFGIGNGRDQDYCCLRGSFARRSRSSSSRSRTRSSRATARATPCGSRSKSLRKRNALRATTSRSALKVQCRASESIGASTPWSTSSRSSASDRPDSSHSSSRENS